MRKLKWFTYKLQTHGCYSTPYDGYRTVLADTVLGFRQSTCGYNVILMGADESKLEQYILDETEKNELGMPQAASIEALSERLEKALAGE